MPADCAGSSSECVLVLAPMGRDGQVLCRLLGENGFTAVRCQDAADLAARLRDSAGAALLTEEALTPATIASLKQALADQPPWSDLPILLLTGEQSLIPADLRAATLFGGDGNLLVLHRPARELSLVTAVQSALRARRRQYQVRDLLEGEQAARAEAEAANRIKDAFLANVTHELRTPLSSILLWTRLLRDARVPPTQIADALAAIECDAVAQSQLVEDLLDVSRMNAGILRLDLQDCAIGPLVQSAVEFARPAAEAKHLRFETVIDPDAGVARADPARLQQILRNLLSNAINFTPTGGQVHVRVDRAADQVRLQVVDTGQGIEADFLPHVFERFRQAEAPNTRREAGLGLGLAIVRQLVEAHGGSVTAESAGETQGATFTVLLPAIPTLQEGIASAKLANAQMIAE